MRVDVVVPQHGGAALTLSCLRHLAAQTIAHRVVVVDDRSPDDSVAQVRAAFPDVEVLESDVNRGFGATCNRGIRATDGDVVVLLNNDVDAAPDMLERLVAPLAADPALGSVAPLVLRPDGLIDSVGLCADPTLAGFPRLQGRPAAEADAAEPVLLGPTGAVAAYRRAALDDAGLFDEAIFLYQEDLDLALRLRAAGWPAAVATDATGVHHGSATTGRRSAFQRRCAGFARGYLLRAYGVGRSRWAPRALLTEAVVMGGDLVISRDLAALQGRAAGWRAGRRAAPPRARPAEGVDTAIGLRRSFALRRLDYAVAE